MESAEDNIESIAGVAAPLAGPVAAEATASLADAEGIDELGSDQPKVSRGWITLLFFGIFGVYLAYVTPVAISLSIRVQDLAADHDEYLGLIIGVGALAALPLGPLAGQLSDRTRSRLGRRRPWLIGGTLGGVLALAVMAFAPNVFVLGLGWVLAQMTFSLVVNGFVTIQADRLPAVQRGRVAGITGTAQQIAPVVGAVIGGSLAANPYLMMLIPGIFAVLLVGLFVIFYKEPDSRGLTFDAPLSVRKVLAGYVFNPMENRDFGWNWLARLFFFFGLTLSSTYTAFFFASKLGLQVAEVGGLIATAGLLGIVGTIGGALGGGFLTDKLRRRKPFVLGSAIIFAGATTLMAFAPNLPVLLVGSFLTTLAIGIFSSVDQALMIDVLPAKETDAGRFVSITGYSIAIAQATAPFLASGLLLIGATGAGGQNYTVLYIVAGIFTIIGGLIVLRVKSVR
ncbi:MFS transporter [Microbacterium sp. SS28]|uniref:MFS transporter n=1 Tax=Microbacterium sp. SS28 TaxID=2919948 RepID=UPI001FAA594F|nr:MFS transporter [Microbacterium sp. SS28]